ncbi:helix-turn-helix domain-containing protein [Pseudodesulfovibrio cashew]|uniref:Helix-turn-helix domain-containing protein n=1 Tax=Pseudodesulfovibrio cashew TaxID=2678688 RepID=A0A6I6J894_9BACT|nr:helix-turn-helix domain-containing protein [Pseudodesulfovibrio cashew]QGY39046.1 helix-turn-helix domain-containing protein [Pseudodesulfovibrio cashew]
MDSLTLCRKLKTLMSTDTGETGCNPLPFPGTLSFTRTHRLHAVCPPQSAVVFVLEGTKTVTRGHERIEVRSGQGLLFPARMETSIENRPDSGSGRYSALFLPYDEAMIARAMTGPGPDAAPMPPLDGLRLDCDPVIGNALIHLVEMATEGGNDRVLDLCREALLLLIADRIDCLPLLWTSARTWSARCGSVIGMNPGRDWTARDIAERLGTSERTLRRRLSGEDCGLRRILREVRLNTGLGMLQSGRTSVGEVAYRCGYNSASRFAGLFRERFGISPGEVLRCAASGQPLAGS